MEALKDVIAQGRKEGWFLGPDDVKFIKRLGSGASGVTYLGEARGRDVALKVYSEAILERDSTSVKNEILIGSVLKHPNVIEFIGMLVDPPTIALVTTFLPNGELGDAMYTSSTPLRRKGDDVKFRVAVGMAHGLQYLHANNIIHRDIKPANILLDKEYNACVTDFGFSRHVDPSVHMTGQTGSFRYMAPEVVRSSDYSVKADVFSFAMIVNEIFMGERPYPFYSAPDVALSVARNGLRPPQGRIRNARLRTIIARSWDQDPALRPDWPEIISEIESARLEMVVRRSAGIGKLFSGKRSGSVHSSGGDKSGRLSISDQSSSTVPVVETKDSKET